jgi:hypothetical protein
MVYRGIPVEQVRQQFEAMKTQPVEVLPVVKVKRKLRIPSSDNK